MELLYRVGMLIHTNLWILRNAQTRKRNELQGLSLLEESYQKKSHYLRIHAAFVALISSLKSSQLSSCMMATTSSYYFQKKNHWLKFYRRIMENKRVQHSVLQKYLTPEKIEELKSNMQQQFEELLPQIPDFGRMQINQFSTDMVKTALSLAFYRVLKEEGFQLHVIGQMIFEIAEAYYGSLNPIMKFAMRRFYLSSSTHRKAKKAIEQRKLPVDPEDYHCAFVEGDQENLLFGMDYTNCAGFHFLKHQNAIELAPYLCLCDYPIYRAINIGFNRSQNLAIGGTACTFRFYRDYPTERGWPPEEVTEYKDFKFKE